MTKRKTTVRLKVRDAGDDMEYEAVVRRSDGEVLNISGHTCCDTKECISQIVKRALTSRRELPDSVEKAARQVVNYLLTSIKSFHAKYVSADLSIDVGTLCTEAEVGLSVSLRYLDGGEDEYDEEEYVGWYAKVEAWFSGCDGVSTIDGYHHFRKELELGRHLGDDAAKRLTEELIKLAKLAYNVSPAMT